MIPDLEEAEDNLVTFLNANAPSFANNFVSSGDVEAVKAAIMRSPAGFVLFESEQYDERELDGGQSGKAYWQVLTVHQGLRGQLEARKGAKGAYKGSKELIDAVRNFDPISNTNIGPTFPMSFLERHLYPDSDSSKYYMLHRFSHPIDSYL